MVNKGEIAVLCIKWDKPLSGVRGDCNALSSWPAPQSESRSRFLAAESVRMTDPTEDAATANFLKAIVEGKVTPVQMAQVAWALQAPSENPSPESEKAAKDMRAEARAQIPSTFVDTWTTLTFRGHIRLVLGETFATGDQYRAAFVIPLDEAQELAEHIMRVVERRRAKDAATDEPPIEDD